MGWACHPPSQPGTSLASDDEEESSPPGHAAGGGWPTCEQQNMLAGEHAPATWTHRVSQCLQHRCCHGPARAWPCVLCLSCAKLHIWFFPLRCQHLTQFSTKPQFLACVLTSDPGPLLLAAMADLQGALALRGARSLCRSHSRSGPAPGCPARPAAWRPSCAFVPVTTTAARAWLGSSEARVSSQQRGGRGVAGRTSSTRQGSGPCLALCAGSCLRLVQRPLRRPQTSFPRLEGRDQLGRAWRCGRGLDKLASEHATSHSVYLA